METTKIRLLVPVLLLVNLSLFAQSPILVKSTKLNDKTEQFWVEWTKDLYEQGVKITKDSVHLSPNARRILVDAALRKVLYPKTYSWAVAKELMKRMQLKPAFWYLLNLYGNDTANKRYVISALLPYDGLYKMDKALTASFYTYAMLDPAVCTVKNGKPAITNPALLEKKFNNLKELIGYIQLYRKQNQDKK